MLNYFCLQSLLSAPQIPEKSAKCMRAKDAPERKKNWWSLHQPSTLPTIIINFSSHFLSSLNTWAYTAVAISDSLFTVDWHCWQIRPIALAYFWNSSAASIDLRLHRHRITLGPESTAVMSGAGGMGDDDDDDMMPAQKITHHKHNFSWAQLGRWRQCNVWLWRQWEQVEEKAGAQCGAGGRERKVFNESKFSSTRTDASCTRRDHF